MRPCITIKAGPKEIQVTHITVEPEIDENGNVMYCLVGYYLGKYIKTKANLNGSSDLDRMISELAIMTGQLVRVKENNIREVWEKEHEEKKKGSC